MVTTLEHLRSKNWMRALADHFKTMRKKYPDDDLLILFDIDDTIVDIRYAIKYALHKYDLKNDKNYFGRIKIDDIPIGYWTLSKDFSNLFEKYGVSADEISEAIKEVDKILWSDEVILASHKPFQGVLEIIRWFQIQEKTNVALNTGRSEKLREVTLKSLNRLGKEFRVQFSNDLLYMNPGGENYEDSIEEYKAKGVMHYQNQGFRVIAMLDNEPANLRLVSLQINDPEILLLHADTRFMTPKALTPKNAIAGMNFDLTEVASKAMLPKHINFVWNGVNTWDNLERFIASEVQWAELDVRQIPISQKIIVRYDSFDTHHPKDEHLIDLVDMLLELKKHQRSVKLVFKEDMSVLEKTINIVKSLDFSEEQLWFHIIIERYSKSSILMLREEFPEAIISISTDFIIPLMDISPKKSREILKELKNWGINRFSISWYSHNKSKFARYMQKWKFEYSIRDAYSLFSFLRSTLLLPAAITSDFYFPLWRLYGVGKTTEREDLY